MGADLQHVKGEQCIVVRTKDAKIVLTNPVSQLTYSIKGSNLHVHNLIMLQYINEKI